MRKDIDKLIADIQALAIKVSKKTKHDAFLRYYGHIDVYEVYYIKNGFPTGKNDYKSTELGSINLSNDNKVLKSELMRIKNKLNELLEGDK